MREEETLFRVLAIPGLELDIYCAGDFSKLNEIKKGSYEERIRVPRGEIVLCRKDGTRLDFLCKWISD